MEMLETEFVTYTCLGMPVRSENLQSTRKEGWTQRPLVGISLDMLKGLKGTDFTVHLIELELWNQ